MKQIPMCWKCASAILTRKETSDKLCLEFIGCKECAEINNWKDAKALCPLLVTDKDREDYDYQQGGHIFGPNLDQHP